MVPPPTASIAATPPLPVPADSAADAHPSRWQAIGRALHELADRRYRWFHQLALVFSLVLVPITLFRFDAIVWGERFEQAGYQLTIVMWFMAASYAMRTIGFREVIRFWLMGFFTVILLTYLITKPMRSLLGAGNLQSGVWVPLVEELIKILPVVAWATIMRPRFRHATLSDFWLVGLAVGCGFSFHEDSLYVRLASSGFTGGIRGTLFPTTYDTGAQYVIVHSGWTALAALGVGIIALYRHRWWGWAGGALLIAISIVDHAAANWRDSGFLSAITGDGQLAGWLLLLSVLFVIGHDSAMLRWASRRDYTFPPAEIRADVAALKVPGVDRRVSGLLWQQRYRRLRTAVFTDLFRNKIRSEPTGDRSAVVRQLAVTALHAGKPIDRRLATVGRNAADQ